MERCIKCPIGSCLKCPIIYTYIIIGGMEGLLKCPKICEKGHRIQLKHSKLGEEGNGEVNPYYTEANSQQDLIPHY